MTVEIGGPGKCLRSALRRLDVLPILASRAAYLASEGTITGAGGARSSPSAPRGPSPGALGALSRRSSHDPILVGENGVLKGNRAHPWVIDRLGVQVRLYDFARRPYRSSERALAPHIQAIEAQRAALDERVEANRRAGSSERTWKVLSPCSKVGPSRSRTRPSRRPCPRSYRLARSSSRLRLAHRFLRQVACPARSLWSSTGSTRPKAK